jgi:hypothetical protein
LIGAFPIIISSFSSLNCNGVPSEEAKDISDVTGNTHKLVFSSVVICVAESVILLIIDIAYSHFFI